MSRRRKKPHSSSVLAPVDEASLVAPGSPDPGVPAPPARSRTHDVAAGALLAIAAVAMGRVVFQLHQTPFYGVETDLLGEYIPVARDLLVGRLHLDALVARGPVYPILLALVSRLTAGDFFLAARVVSFLSALLAGAATYLLVADFLGGFAGLGTLVLLLCTPVFIECTVHASGDMPGFALMVLAAWLVCFRRGPRVMLTAGFVTALAVLSRPNAVTLIPAAAIALWSGRGRMRRAVLYGAALAIPVGIWWVFLLAHGVNLGSSARDALNMAYEFYRGDAGWEDFWRTTSRPFHSISEVIRYAPGTFFTHLARNLATRAWVDARQLLPIGVGLVAVPGMLLSWWRRPQWAAMLAHFFFTYAMLALVFYTPRFFLFLLPFYLSGAVGGLRVAAEWLARRTGPALLQPARVLVVLIVGSVAAVSGVAGSKDIAQSLDDAPVETVEAARVLRSVGTPDQRVMARKPHVAYFAGMQHVPMPQIGGYQAFLAEAREAHADYLMISPIEITLRPRLALLLDSDLSIPGLRPIARGEGKAGHFFVLYRFTGEVSEDGAFEESLLVAMRLFAMRRPGNGSALGQYGLELIGADRNREAIPVLIAAAKWNANDPAPNRALAVAYAKLGRYEDAISMVRVVCSQDADTAWSEGFIGQVRLQQGRFDDARSRFATAVRLSPANVRLLALYVRACFGDSAWRDAAEAGERALRLTPGDAEIRRITIDSWHALGRDDRARALVAAREP
jgi:4-amino-4-deoxy-L-arabinose transferase-like glycosyltransferase